MTTSITVSWADPGGVQDYFEVDCGSDSSTPFHRIYPDDSFEATCAINDASIDHTITVTAVSGDKRNPTVGTFTPGGKRVVFIRRSNLCGLNEDFVSSIFPHFSKILREQQ